MQDANMTSRIIRSSIFGTGAFAALIFIPAGTFHYWQGWIYLVVWVASCAAYTAYLFKHDPALLKRRTQAGVAHEKEPAQKIIIFLFYVAFVALQVLPPLDFRF